MGLVTGIVVYVIIWWLVLLAVLPWGVRVPEETDKGFATSAPANPRLWLKAGVTSVIAAVLWAVVYAVIESGLISFRAA